MIFSVYVACDECGASVHRAHVAEHECAPDAIAAKETLAEFAHARVTRDGTVLMWWATFSAWLITPAGRFEAFYAERSRHRDRNTSEGTGRVLDGRRAGALRREL